MPTYTVTLADIFDRPLARFEEMPLDAELALIAEAQDGSDSAKLQLLRQYAAGLRSIASREYARAGGTAAGEDPDEVRANVLVAFMEALAACDGTTRLARHLKGATLEASNTYHVRSTFTVPARTRQRYFQALREAGPSGNAEDKAVELGMSREVFREVARAFGARSLEAMEDHRRKASPGSEVDLASGSKHGGDGWGLETEAIGATERSYATAEDRLTLARAYTAVDEDTLGIIEDAYGFAFYDDDSTPESPVRERDPYAGFDPIPDTQIAHLRGLSRSGVQRKRTEGIAAMRKAVGA